MQIIYKKPDELKPYENNPRINDDAVQYVKESIRQFGFKNPVIIDKNNVIVCGHTRLLAAKELKLATVPCIMADDLTDEEIKGFRLADNKVAEFSRWDFDKLEVELDDLDIDMSVLGFDDNEFDFDDDDEYENKYSDKTDIPQYQPTLDHVDVEQLVDDTKVKELLKDIEKAKIDDDVKEFLRIAAYRHYCFDYKKIAEYYAQADKTIQGLFEKSALVIIDYENALRNGYIKLTETVDELLNE